MLARVVADCAASRRLFMLRIKKSSLIRFVAPPFQNANSSLVCILVFFLVATIVATQRSIPIPVAFWQDLRTRP